MQANESDLLRAVRDGVLDWDGVCELGDVILKNAPGRTTPEEITLFKFRDWGSWTWRWGCGRTKR